MWPWVLGGLVLLVVAGVVLGLAGLGLWRRTKALLRELDRTAVAVGAVAERLEDLPEPQVAHRPGTAPGA